MTYSYQKCMINRKRFITNQVIATCRSVYESLLSSVLSSELVYKYSYVESSLCYPFTPKFRVKKDWHGRPPNAESILRR